MRKEKTLFIIGFWIIILPFLGFPSSWKNIFFVLTGFVLFYLGYLFYMEARARLVNKNESQSFIDNIDDLNESI